MDYHLLPFISNTLEVVNEYKYLGSIVMQVTEDASKKYYADCNEEDGRSNRRRAYSFLEIC